MGTPTTATASLVSLVPRSTALRCGPPPPRGGFVSGNLAIIRTKRMVNASRNGQIGKTDALISLPAGEGDRSGASFKAFCFEMREAVAVVGVPISPLSHRCI